MPINAGTATPTFRLGTAAVSRMYLGSASVYDPAGTGGGGGAVGGIPKPSSLTVVAGNASVVLQFRCATGPTSFQIQYSTNGGAVWTTVPSGYTYSQTVAAGVITGTATIGSLTNGSTYTFRVAGVTASGIGAYSDNSPAAILRTVPTTPTGVTAAVSGRFINLSWTASTGSAAIEYTVQFSADSGATWGMLSSRIASTAISEWPGNGVSALTPGTSYVFRVCATYAPLFAASVYAPQSAFSTASSAVTAPLQEPPAPSLLVEPTNGALVIEVASPDWNGGAAITASRVYVYAATSSRPSTPTHTISGSSGGTVASTGLANGTAVLVDACAVNSVGAGAFASTTATPLAAIPAQVPALTVECGASVDFNNGMTLEPRKTAIVKWASSGYASRPSSPLFEVQYAATYAPSWVSQLSPPQLNSTASPPFYYTSILVVPGAATRFRVREVDGALTGPWRYATSTCP